jgi:SAM-dependent methyltransferase
MSSEDSGLHSTWDARRYQARHSYVWKFGEDLIELLDPQPGERIVDLGCGSGQLAARIAAKGATVIGIDASGEMIGEARRNFPGIDFRVGNAESFQVEARADAVFSNAALHWVKDQTAAIGSIRRALRPGGRFVAELGGKGNIAMILQAAGGVHPWYFPGIADYSILLERHGFEVRFATLFDRPTPIEGENGLEEWLGMFAGWMTTDAKSVVEHLRPQMYRNGVWYLDYRRLRILAVAAGA